MQPQLLGVILFRKKNISSNDPIWQNVLPSFVTLVLVMWPTMRTWVRWTCRDQARSVMPDPDYHQHPSCHLKTRLLRHLGVIFFFCYIVTKKSGEECTVGANHLQEFLAGRYMGKPKSEKRERLVATAWGCKTSMWFEPLCGFNSTALNARW